MQTPSEEELLRTQYVDLNKVQLKFLKYAPPYAIKEAREAMIRVQQLQSQGVLRNGVYYLVLIDLVGSTKFAAAHGNQKAAGRIQLFVKASFNSLNAANLKNVGLFVEEIGDAVLYVFSHFTDILAGYNAFAPSWQFGGRCPGSLF